jgi:hypothetical protein
LKSATVRNLLQTPAALDNTVAAGPVLQKEFEDDPFLLLFAEKEFKPFVPES